MPKFTPNDPNAYARRVRRHVNGRLREYYVVTPPGMEKICLRELSDIGISREKVRMAPGGITFSGRFVDCMRANLHLRTATRILMRIGSFSATNRRQLKKKIEEIPWELFLPPDHNPDLKTRSIKSRLYHTDAINEGVMAGITSRMGEPSLENVQSTPQAIFVRTVSDRFTVSLDSSGEPLHKRGLKRGPAKAPIRETLAAAILYISGYDPKRPLVDPMCGSGTFSLEAGLMAKQMAPGLHRSFSFMCWPAYRNSQWAFEIQSAASGILKLNQPPIFASDLDSTTCERLKETIAERDLTDAIMVQHKNFFDCHAGLYSRNPGLIAINPPYGRRLGSSKQAYDLFNDVCHHLIREFKGWSVALISPRPDFSHRLPFPAKRLPLFHGGLNLTLITGTIR